MNSTWKALAYISITFGFSCLFFSIFIDPKTLAFTVTLALGLSLLPTGIISIITSISSSNIVEESIRKKLEETNLSLQTSINSLQVASEYLNKSKELGVEMVYQNRNQALHPFLNHLEIYVQQGSDKEDVKNSDESRNTKDPFKKKQIIFVGSSLKGVIEDDPKYAAQLERILHFGKDNCEFSFLLTHPHFSEFREIQEDRPPGGIAKEILHAIAWLEERGIEQSRIKLYKGTPTCFLIASREKMIINPYPYEREAYKSFSLLLKNIGNERSIYYFFWTNHYYRPWFGEEKRKDHFITPNSLGYIHDALDGPIPVDRHVSSEADDPYADFFIINDTGSFYLAVNVRGLHSEIPYSRQADGSCSIIKIGRVLSVKLLDLSEGKNEWVMIGTLELSDIRNGFWHQTLRNLKSLETYAMIGVFDDQLNNPFNFEDNKILEGQSLPMLWKWLHNVSNTASFLGKSKNDKKC